MRRARLILNKPAPPWLKKSAVEVPEAYPRSTSVTLDGEAALLDSTWLIALKRKPIELTKTVKSFDAHLRVLEQRIEAAEDHRQALSENKTSGKHMEVKVEFAYSRFSGGECSQAPTKMI
jgi:hypothetical protein